MVNVKLSALTRCVVAVGAVLMVLGVSACGSSGKTGTGKSGSSASSGLSQAALVSQATKICTKHNDLITAGSQKMLAGGSFPTPKVFAKFAFGTLVPQYTDIANELSALKPASNAAAYTAWLSNTRAVIAEIQKDPMKVQHGSTFKTVNAEAKALGLSPACNAGPSS